MIPALALTPDVTTQEPKAPSKTPEPSPVPDPGPKKTVAIEDPAPSPTPAAHPQIVPQPKNTAALPQQDPAESKSSSPANRIPVLPSPNVQQAAHSADPPQIPHKDVEPAARISADPPTPSSHALGLDSSSPSVDFDVQYPTPVTSNSQDEDPNHPEPPSRGKFSPPMTIQLGPQSNKRPTTIFLGGGPDEGESSSGLGALIFNALGRVEPTAKPDSSSDPKVSIGDPASSFPTVTAAGQLLTISDTSAVSIAGTVLTPGGAEATIAGTPVSLAPSGNLVVGTGPSHQSITVLTIAGHTITANPTSFQIAGTPVKAGEPAVIVSGTAVSIGLSGDLVIGGSASTTSSLATIFTVGAQRSTVNGAGLVGSGTTFHAGGPAVLVEGNSVNLGHSGVLVVGSITTNSAGLSQSSIFTVGDQTFTANPTKFPIAGAILSAGGPDIIVDSTLISLNPSGFLLIGTSTIPLQIPTPAITTADGHVLTIEQGGLIAVDGVTLSNGSPRTTVSGTPISADLGGIMIGSDTVRLPTVNGSASSTMIPFTGAAMQSAEVSRFVLWGLLVLVVAL